MKLKFAFVVALGLSIITVWLIIVAIKFKNQPIELPVINYFATCYSGDKIIFERDGVLIDGHFDAGDRKYKLPSNCILEVINE